MTTAANYPNVLIVTEDILAPSHGTGTTLMRHFRGYPQDKLLNLYRDRVTTDGAMMQSVMIEYPTEAWNEWHDSGRTRWDVFVPTESIREKIERTGFKPDVIYSTYFGMFGYMLTQRLLEEYDFQLPVIQHFHDLMMPDDDLQPFFAALQRGLDRYDEVWALTHAIAADVHNHTGHHIDVVNTFCDVPPPVTKQTHREFDSGFKAVITGNIWVEETIVDLKAAWGALQRENPELQPIQWYCHPDRMRDNLERYVFDDKNSPVAYGGFLNRDELYATLADADMAIVPFNRSQYPDSNYAKYSLPSRLTETVLAGTPVFALAGSETETAHYIKKHGIGVTSNPSVKSSFQQDLREFVRDRERREQMGQQAAILAEQYDLARYQGFFFSKLRDLAEKPRTAGTVKKHSVQTEALPADTRKVSILICTPDVNSELTQRCIHSIRKHTPRISYEILLFENGKYGEFNHAREMNRALEIAQGDVFVSLDDDVEVTRGWLEALLELATPDVGIVGCVHWHGRDRAARQYTSHRQISHAGGTLKADDGTAVHYTRIIDQPIAAPYACSACVLINDMSLRFDTTYKKYYHDVDISLESWNRGKKVVISPHPIYHYVNGQMHKLGNSREDVHSASELDLDTFREKWIIGGQLSDLEQRVADQLDVPIMHNDREFMQLMELEGNGGEQQPVGDFDDGIDTFAEVSAGSFQMTSPLQNVRPDMSRAQLSTMYRSYTESRNTYRQWDGLRTRQDRISERHPLFSRFNPLKKMYRLTARVYKLGLVWSYLELYFRNQVRFFSDTVSFGESMLKTTNRLQQELYEARETLNRATEDIEFLREQLSAMDQRRGEEEDERS